VDEQQTARYLRKSSRAAMLRFQTQLAATTYANAHRRRLRGGRMSTPRSTSYSVLLPVIALDGKWLNAVESARICHGFRTSESVALDWGLVTNLLKRRLRASRRRVPNVAAL
jgi:hypothetical protein